MSGKSWQVLENLTDWLEGGQGVERFHSLPLYGGVIGDLPVLQRQFSKRGCQFIQIQVYWRRSI
jgi:hypothetical protein